MSTSSRRNLWAVGGLAVGSSLAAQWWIWANARWLTVVAFAGSSDRIERLSGRHQRSLGLAGDVAVATASWFAAAVACSGALWFLWDHGWRAEGQRKARGWVWTIPMVSAVLGIAQAVLVLLLVDDRGNEVAAGQVAAVVLAALGQLVWFTMFATFALLFFTLYGALRFQGLSLEASPPTTLAQHGEAITECPSGSAICLSGGGIRSASFSWGALAELERHRPLGEFDRMYSVSGGGYAATALTAAIGRQPDARFFGDAQLAPIEEPARYEYVRGRQRFLGAGPGGLVRPIVLSLTSVMFNLGVIFLGVVVVSVPIGLIAGSELGSGSRSPDPYVWYPVLVIAGLGAVLALASSIADRSEPRRVLKMAGAVLAGAATVGFVRGGVPWLTDNLESVLSGRWWKRVIPGVVLWLLTAAFAFLRPRLTKVAARLGGLVTVLAMLAGVVLVVRRTIASDTEWWGIAAPFWVVVAGLAVLIAVDFSGVQWWSFHPIYRDSLARTFLMTKPESDGALRNQRSTEWVRWSKLDGQKPVHTICAATHRRESDVTGLRSTSFTFSPDGVRLHHAQRDPVTGAVSVATWHRDARWLETAVGADHGRRQGRKGSTVIAAAAISGAAFNSAMGRHSQGSTDSLLALLNLRLGVWLPNPRFESTRDRKSFPRPGLRYLFNEVTGYYDVTEPFIHVSDGGHWENLGLVEALRARHEHIFCVDASGDRFQEPTAGGVVIGLGTLYEAIDLARIELHVEVRVDPEQFEKMRPDGRTGRCVRNWMTCDIVYHTDPDHDWRECCNCHSGRLLFVKALISDRTPESVLSFANADRAFPHYPTADQFLTDGQFRSLVGLGESATRDAMVKIKDAFFAEPTRVCVLNAVPQEQPPASGVEEQANAQL